MLNNINVYITSAAQKDGLVHCLFNVASIFDNPGTKSTVGTCSKFTCALPPTSQPATVQPFIPGDAPPAGPCKHACMCHMTLRVMPECGFPTDVLAPIGQTKQQRNIDAGNNRLAASRCMMQ